ncbi:MAG: hypothetical protein ABW078_08940 [Sedimenticola sp.]
MMDAKIEKIVGEVYEAVLKTTDEVLRNCKLFSIEILRLEDPSYEEIAEQMAQLAGLLEVIANGYPDDAEGFHKAMKASEYATEVAYIAKAIRSGNDELLAELVDKLDGRPRL